MNRLDHDQLLSPIFIGRRVAQEWIDVTPGHYTQEEWLDLSERIGAAVQDERDQSGAMIADLEAVLAECHPQWIPVSERLPEWHARVLVSLLYNNEPTILTAVMGVGYWMDDTDGIEIEGVTHWQPLPAAPNKE